MHAPTNYSTVGFIIYITVGYVIYCMLFPPPLPSVACCPHILQYARVHHMEYIYRIYGGPYHLTYPSYSMSHTKCHCLHDVETSEVYQSIVQLTYSKLMVVQPFTDS